MTKIRMFDGKVVDFSDDPNDPMYLTDDEIKALIREKHPQDFEKTAGGFVSNTVDDFRNVWNRLWPLAGKAVENPKKAAEHIIGPPLGAFQKAVRTVEGLPGKRYAEERHFEPWVDSAAGQLGIERRGDGKFGAPNFDAEELINNAYKEPLTTAMSAFGLVPALGYLPGKAGGVARTANRFVTPTNIAGKWSAKAGQKIFGPSSADDLTKAAANRLEKELPGATFTAGQATGSQSIKMLESMFASGKIAEMDVTNLKALTRRAAKEAGIDADVLTGEVMKQRHMKFDGQFKSFTWPNRVNTYPQGAIDITNATRAYTLSGEPVQRGVVGYATKINQMLGRPGGLTGEQYKNIRSHLERLLRGGATPAAKELYGDLVEILDEAAEQSISPQQLANFRNLRQEYRNYKVLEDVMAPGGGVNTSKGLVTPKRLEGSSGRGWRRGGFVRGEGPLTQVARDANVIMGDELPKTGYNWPRWVGNAVGGGAGFGLGSLAGGPISAAAAGGVALGGLLGRYGIGKAVMSRPVQSLLKGDGPKMSIPGNPIGATGRQVAAVENQRQRQLEKANLVLSKDVVNHAKRTPELRVPLNEWLKTGDEKTRMELATAIAQNLKVPQMAERIYKELGEP